MRRLSLAFLLSVSAACAPSVTTGGDSASTAGSTGQTTGVTATSSTTGGGQGGSTTSTTAGGQGGSTASTSTSGGQGGEGGCNDDSDCGSGASCCIGACHDLAVDTSHCGGCDTACTPAPHATVACEGGLCVTGTCEPGYADCNASLLDGCEQNILDGEPCACTPGESKPCYNGGPGTLGVGVCHEGVRTCDADGLAWGDCVGQELPGVELCDNGVDEDCNGVADDVADVDGDGWTICDGDCYENNIGGTLPAPNLVNPGAFEILNNLVDDDCDPSTPDQGPAVTCSDGPLISPVSPDDLRKALDLCQLTEIDPPLAQKKWGVLGASFLLADGSAPSAAQLAAIQAQQTAVLTHFGDGILTHKGATMAGLSTGKMRDAMAPDFVANGPGTDLGSSSSPPASYLAAHNGALPASAGCNGACPSGAGAFDSVRLHITLRVPTNAVSFSYDFRFLTAEYGAHLCSPYNDAFITLLDTKAPGMPADRNIAFDALGSPVLVNDVFFESCVSQGCNTCPLGPGALAGTGMELGGGTPWLTNDAPIKAGEIAQIDWMIFDVTDGSGDSHVLLDNFRWNGPCPNCWGDH
ncbi:MAG: choice-of-anchor L domain-containing protein [Byssovorax sp.]